MANKKAEPKATKKEKHQSHETDGQWKDQFLRVSADFQNYKRRVENERSELIKHAQVSIVEALLPFLDDVERALKVGKDQDISKEMKSWLEGLSAIEKNLKKRLEGLKIKEIDCSSFDPHLHEALVHVDSPNHKTGEIVEVFSKGYCLGDDVIRYAKVSVAK